MKHLASALAGFIFCAPLFAQAPPPPSDRTSLPPAKQAKVGDEILANIESLRLAENRSIALARVGALRCKDDPKGSRELLQRSINELVDSLATEPDTGQQPYEIYSPVASARNLVLNVIAGCDAELALRSLERTRPLSVQKALNKTPETAGKIGSPGDQTGNIASSEFALQQRLVLLAATQDPDRNAKLLQDTIKGNLTSETLRLLTKLFEKNPEAANALAAETIERLASASYSLPSNSSQLLLATNILLTATRDSKPGVAALKFDDAAIRSLSGKVIAYLLSIDPRIAAGFAQPMIRVAEKFSPVSVVALKKIETSRYPPGSIGIGASSDAQKLLQAPNQSPSQLIADAGKLPQAQRAPVIQQAANKMAELDQFSSAVELLNANFTGAALENALESLRWWYAAHLMNHALWAEAETVMDAMNTSNQRSAYTQLAAKAFQSDAVKNKDLAVRVLEKVRSTLPQRPTDQTELSQFMQLAAAFGPISPDDGFRLMDGITPPLNDLADATIIVQAFQHAQLSRSGEFRLAFSGFGFRVDQNAFRKLAGVDLDRTLQSINSFSRREIRIAILLGLLDNQAPGTANGISVGIGM